ncbi:EF-hand domain-containing protein [Azoarcus sp. L1K30]|uniref:EF-hand domain-containing protein n=1 Tax=Azoarcus sp. L1K30 TaxID=2820277 RepID=UPI001B823DA9|nr:EF-hand domain-containing protein [Azoarcus sp. L1K30]MBR0567141.1 EF-hand domain-containing protein [Azoarcus sp. L1K30]
MSSIGSIGSIGSSASAMMQGMRGTSRPDPKQMADELFSTLDTKGTGYIELSTLQDMADSAGNTGSLDVEGLFSQLDGDSDGKVTKDEFSSAFNEVAEQLNSQFDSMRVQEAMGGMPPPPPGGAGDEGFTQDELTAQLEQVGDSDSARSALITSVLENFDTADTDGDGKVSFEEAMALEQNSSSSANTASTTNTDSTGSASPGDDTQLKVVMQTLKLMQTYMLDSNQQQTASSVSVSV